MKHLFAITLLAGAIAFTPSAYAQSEDETESDITTVTDDVCMAIVYGDDDAPQCTGNEMVVIARMPEEDRYRIPETLRFSDDPENTAWANRVESLEMIGAFGALSCSTAGAGGFTGCTEKLLEQAYGEKREGASVRFSELINAARQERLDEIDEQAAEEQERVEAIEREYLERLERERDGPVPNEEAGADGDIEGVEGVETTDSSTTDAGDEGGE